MMIIPGSIIFYRYSSDSQDALVSAQIYKTGSDLIDVADLVYSVGADSWQTLKITFPQDVHELKVYRDGDLSELVIVYGPQHSHAVFFTRTNLRNGTETSDCSSGCNIPIHDGLNRIRVESYADGMVRYRVVV